MHGLLRVRLLGNGHIGKNNDSVIVLIGFVTAADRRMSMMTMHVLAHLLLQHLTRLTGATRKLDDNALVGMRRKQVAVGRSVGCRKSNKIYCVRDNERRLLLERISLVLFQHVNV